MEYHKRKPDKETESMRMWVMDKDKHPEEFKDFESLEDERDIEVKYKDATFKLSGFSKVKNKVNDNVVCAWKIKVEEHLVLLYNPTNMDLGILIKGFEAMGFEVQDVMETLKRAYNEMPNDMKEKIKEETK